MSKFAIRLLTLAMFVVALVAAPAVVYAAPDNDPAPPPPPRAPSPSPRRRPAKSAPASRTRHSPRIPRGYATIYDRNDYAAAIDQLKALVTTTTPPSPL